MRPVSDEEDATVTVLEERDGRPTRVCVVWSEDAPLRLTEVLREPTVTELRIRMPERDDLDEDEWDENDDVAPPANIGGIAVLDLRRLTTLDLSYLLLRVPGAEALAVASLVHLDPGGSGPAEGRIETLDLRYCHVTDEGLAGIAGSPTFRNVRNLHLQANRITAAGVVALHRLRHLEVLDLRYNNLRAEGAEALLRAPFVGNLKRLNLYRTDVGDVGATMLARAPHLPPAIRSIWRSG